MVLGIISVVLGVILVVINMVTKAISAPQQTVQYLGFLIGSVFIIGGAVLISIKQHFDKLESWIYSLKESKKDTPANTSPIAKSSSESQTKKCKQCSKRVGADLTNCPYCGSSDFLWD